MHLRDKVTAAIFQGSPLKRGQKRKAKDTFTAELHKNCVALDQPLHVFLEGNNLCVSSGGFTLNFSDLYYRVCLTGALETSGCFAIKDSLVLRRSPYHTSLMGCTSFQVTHERYQNISNAIPFFTCFLSCFPPLFRADIPT